ncbi:MAG: RNA polymerase sigma-70 factor [Siphonobacter sp.]
MQSLPEHRPKRNSFSEEKTAIVADSELFIRQAFLKDNRKGYELLFRRYYKVLCSHAVRYVYSREVAEDLVSEVFLTFWRNQSFETITSTYRAYLFSAVRKRAISHLQEEFKHHTTDLQEDSSHTEDDPQLILQYTELAHQLENGIRALPPQCQRVFLMSRFEGKKHREIADELQINQKTVEAHLHKALNYLRRIAQNGFLLVFLWLN